MAPPADEDKDSDGGYSEDFSFCTAEEESRPITSRTDGQRQIPTISENQEYSEIPTYRGEEEYDEEDTFDEELQLNRPLIPYMEFPLSNDNTPPQHSPESRLSSVATDAILSAAGESYIDLGVDYNNLFDNEPIYSKFKSNETLSDQDLKLLFRAVSPTNDNIDDPIKNNEVLDELILTSVERAINLGIQTPEVFTAQTTARTESLAHESVEESDEAPSQRKTPKKSSAPKEIQVDPIPIEKSYLEKILDNESLKLKCANPILEYIGEYEWDTFSIVSSICQKAILRYQRLLLKQTRRKVAEQANEILHKNTIVETLEAVISKKKKIIPNKWVFLIGTRTIRDGAIGTSIVQFLKPRNRIEFSVTSKSSKDALAQAMIRVKEDRVQQEKLRYEELELRYHHAKEEVKSMWGNRWKRLEEVAEQNRRLRNPCAPAMLSSKKQYEPGVQVEPELRLTSDEATNQIDVLNKTTGKRLLEIANKELAQFKAAYAQFVTSWSKAVTIADKMEDHGAEEMKNTVASLCKSPKAWNEHTWCEQAVRMAIA